MRVRSRRSFTFAVFPIRIYTKKFPTAREINIIESFVQILEKKYFNIRRMERNLLILEIEDIRKRESKIRFLKAGCICG